MFKLSIFLLLVSPLVLGQQPGTQTPEVHPPWPWQKCEKGGHCNPVHGEIVLDAEWRWIHNGQGQACYNGNQRNAAICATEEACAKNCVLEGTNQYQSTYGVSTSGNSLRMNFVTKHDGGNTIGSRLYLAANATTYQTFSLLAQEFTFDVDVSTLPCGMNAAIYLVAMDPDGGSARHPTNKAGAKFGTGYCDSQCPRVHKFLDGQPGACCAEMDFWEANSMATAMTLHPCDTSAVHMCSGEKCGGTSQDRYGGTCDPDGCGYNSYQMGAHSYYGPGLTVDTKKVFTVVTQFITSDGTPQGSLTEVRRFYVQGGKVIPNSASTIAGIPGHSVTQEFCTDMKTVWKSVDAFGKHGGVKKMGEAIGTGMVLAMALWDDPGSQMAWLDGNDAGPCKATEGKAADLEAHYPNAFVAFSNIKVGPINSTFAA